MSLTVSELISHLNYLQREYRVQPEAVVTLEAETDEFAFLSIDDKTVAVGRVGEAAALVEFPK